jgi:DNA-binding XRE family transcriptional regulator
LYSTLHEADITKFFDIANTYFDNKEISNLKIVRQASGLSQSKLAKLADVKLRSI